MKILNVGTIHPVMVVEGLATQTEIRTLGGVLLGTFDSQVNTTKKSTWISFENMYKMNSAVLMIINKEL